MKGAETISNDIEIIVDGNNHKQKEININGSKFLCDIKCIPLVVFFNNKGLVTEFSCESQGKSHMFRIIFSRKVTSNIIKNFIIQYGSNNHNSLMLGSISNWVRVSNGKYINNWMYEAETISDADNDLKLFESKLM